MTQRKIQLDQLELSGSSLILPPGVMLPYAAGSAPTGFLLCDGAVYSTATYPELFAVVGYTYGGSGANFQVPDMRGRVPVGQKSSGAFNVALGTVVGAEDVTLTASQMPSHSHSASGTATSSGAHSHTVTGTVGGGGTHTHRRDFGTYSNNGGGGSTSHYPLNAPGTEVTYTRSGDGSHTHTLSGASALSAGSHTHTLSISIGSAGSGGSHTNIQPSFVSQYIISTGV